jgi:hypothetical protein
MSALNYLQQVGQNMISNGMVEFSSPILVAKSVSTYSNQTTGGLVISLNQGIIYAIATDFGTSAYSLATKARQSQAPSGVTVTSNSQGNGKLSQIVNIVTGATTITKVLYDFTGSSIITRGSSKPGAYSGMTIQFRSVLQSFFTINGKNIEYNFAIKPSGFQAYLITNDPSATGIPFNYEIWGFRYNTRNPNAEPVLLFVGSGSAPNNINPRLAEGNISTSYYFSAIEIRLYGGGNPGTDNTWIKGGVEFFGTVKPIVFNNF